MALNMFLGLENKAILLDRNLSIKLFWKDAVVFPFLLKLKLAHTILLTFFAVYGSPAYTYTCHLLTQKIRLLQIFVFIPVYSSLLG